MAQVFLSYAREDRDRVAPLVELLTSMGASVFWDRLVPAGSSWREILDRELQDAQATLVAWSRHSIDSEWVIEEAEVAKRQGRLVPFLLDAVDPPIGFRSTQAADLTSWTGDPDDPAVREFAVGVTRRLGIDGPDATPQTSTPSARHGTAEEARGRSLPRWSYWLGLAAVVGVVGSMVASERGSTLPEPPQDPQSEPASTSNGGASASGETGTGALAIANGSDSTTGEPPEVTYLRVYYEGFSSANEIEQEIWPLGPRGDWHGERTDAGTFLLCNRSEAETASFTSKTIFSDDTKPSFDHSRAHVVVTVRLHPPLSRYSSAGLLYHANSAADVDAYYAFALSAGHTVTFLRTEGTKVSLIGTWVLNGFEDGQSATLRIEGNDEGFTLFIDDKLVHTETKTIQRGAPGIFAMGLGCFEFDNYSLLLPTKEVSGVASQ